MNTFVQYSVFLIVALISAATGYFVFQTQQNTAPATTQTQAIQFELPDRTGKMRHINEWQGKILVINFWATWCPPCRKEIPDFIELQTEFQAQNVQFIGIATADKAENVEEFLQQVPVNYPILMAGDTGITLSKKLGNLLGGLPFTLVINQDGDVYDKITGEWLKGEAQKTLKQLITQPGLNN